MFSHGDCVQEGLQVLTAFLLLTVIIAGDLSDETRLYIEETLRIR